VAVKFSQTQKENCRQPYITSGRFHEWKTVWRICERALIGTYNYPFEKNHPFWNAKFELHFENLSQKKLDHIGQKAEALSNGQISCQEWMNKPANLKRPDTFSLYLKNMAKKYDLKIYCFQQKEMWRIRSRRLPCCESGKCLWCCFTILEYKTTVKNAKTFGLVGKCVSCLIQEEFLWNPLPICTIWNRTWVELRLFWNVDLCCGNETAG
jgi:leucyl aminopeptidase